MSTPLIRSLKQAWPKALIDVLVYKNTEDILKANQDIHRIIMTPESTGFLASLKLLLKLIRRYDLSISTLAGDRPIFYSWVTGKSRVGLLEDMNPKHLWKKLLLTDSTLLDNINTHSVLMNLKLADLLGIKRYYEITIPWEKKDEKRVIEFLSFDIFESFALLHVYPKLSYKKWHQDGWIKVSRWLNEKGIRTVLTGSNAPDELAYIEQIFKSLPNSAVNTSGRLSLAEVSFLISHASIYIGPDTATTHMAAALGVPTVALYGPSNPVKWGPWPKDQKINENPYVMCGSQKVGNVELIQGTGDCVPCREEGCERHIESLSTCLQKIEPAVVIKAVQSALNIP
jgi:heptosyltransferase-3